VEREADDLIVDVHHVLGAGSLRLREAARLTARVRVVEALALQPLDGAMEAASVGTRLHDLTSLPMTLPYLSVATPTYAGRMKTGCVFLICRFCAWVIVTLPVRASSFSCRRLSRTPPSCAFAFATSSALSARFGWACAASMTAARCVA